MSEVFEEISPADFFYRNRDLAGFSNPTRAVYAIVRELVENSLDACELVRVPPDIYVRLSREKPLGEGEEVYSIRVTDNGSGVPLEYIPSAFGQILFGSKYTLRQVRGTFGLGGKMAILYGQITTHSSAHIISSTGTEKINEFVISIDIQRNRPIILKRKVHSNKRKWHGTVIEFAFDGNYTRAMSNILEYLMQTAIACPYANIVFVDPRGRLYRFDRTTRKMPVPPKETLPHPYGVDVETIQRIINATDCSDMFCFLTKHFHRVGKNTAGNFCTYAGLKTGRDPKSLTPDEIVGLVRAMKSFKGFLPPSASCLSPIGVELLELGVRKELNPEFVAVEQRTPSAYSGFPFIIEIGIAYGGGVPDKPRISLYRFANRIPLLFDESSDVAWKVANNMINWRYYNVTPDMPIALIVHICSTRIPYKTVGKEFIADRPEVEAELLSGAREVARQLSRFLSRKISFEHEKRRIAIFAKFLPKIARFSTELAGEEKIPDINRLLEGLSKYDEKEES